MIFKTFFVKLGVEGVEVLFVEPVGEDSKILAEALIMHDLAFSEEAYSVLYVGIVAERALCKHYVMPLLTVF